MGALAYTFYSYKEFRMKVSKLKAVRRIATIGKTAALIMLIGCASIAPASLGRP
jgi:hypothetical protein